MAKITSHLKQQYFDHIKDGTKTIEIRVYDEKRRKFKVGDIITFVVQGDETQSVKCRIVNLLVYDSFDELYNDYDKTELGYDEDEKADPSDMYQIYPKEEADKYGVVAIEIELL